MKNPTFILRLIGPALLALSAACGNSSEATVTNEQEMKTVEQIKTAMAGNWVSLTPEVRPSKTPDGTLKPFYLKRSFGYQSNDRFELSIMNYADPFGKVAIAQIDIAGHMFWHGHHPVAAG